MNSTREHALLRLEQQGLTFDEQQQVFHCKYCPNGINSRHIADANRHVATEKHRSCKNDFMRERRDNTRDFVFTNFIKKSRIDRAVDRASLKRVE